MDIGFSENLEKGGWGGASYRETAGDATAHPGTKGIPNYTIVNPRKLTFCLHI